MRLMQIPQTETPAVRPPQVTWDIAAIATTLKPGTLDRPCPNCGATARKSIVVAVDFITPDHPMRRSHVLRCPDCTCCFFDDQTPPDYAEEAMLGRGRVPFHIQHGAGLWQITRPLGQIRKPAGSNYTEVGCGFGFGVDFAIRAKGWHGRGLDPGGISRLGREALGVPIELRYLREDDEAIGTMDVVMGSEVLEHVPSPRRFIRTLRRMLRPGGILILTTPNADHITPATPAGALVPLLSPGLHLILHNPHSITQLLRLAGFLHIRIDIDSHALIAFASDAPLDLEDDTRVLRRSYIDYLITRARELPAGSDVFLGLAGRAFIESVNDGESAGARECWDLLSAACRNRFGIDLDRIEALPPGAAEAELEHLARLMPLSLGTLLYGSAMLALLTGTPRSELAQRFLLAAKACAVLRRSLGRLAMEDAMAEDIGWTATAEGLLCAAAAGEPDIVSRLIHLPAAPVNPERRRGVIERALTTLVNAGQYGPALELVGAEGWLTELPVPETMEASTRDAMFSVGVLWVQPGGDAAQARERFVLARHGLTEHHHLFWPALIGELNALTVMGATAEAAKLAQEAVQTAHAPGAVPAEVRAYAAAEEQN
jgi:SAM-dependent methyltransferase